KMRRRKASQARRDEIERRKLVTDVFREMLDEVAPTSSSGEGQPIKRRRTGKAGDSVHQHGPYIKHTPDRSPKRFDEPSFNLEDVVPKEMQTIYDDSEGSENSDDSEIAWEEVELGYGAEAGRTIKDDDEAANL